WAGMQLLVAAVVFGLPGTMSPIVKGIGLLGAVTGPLAGGIARSGQSCCVAFSMATLAVCAPFVLLTIAGFVFRHHRILRVQRFATAGWVTGIAGWMGGAVVSLLHALS